MKRFILFVAAGALLFSLGLARPSTPAPIISFADRLWAQESIERVYYSHLIDAHKPFEEAVPASLIERKVRTYLQQSVALEKLWNTPITIEALDREVDRMRRTTRMPDRLQELFAALDNQPVKIRECLARPVLAARLLRNFYATDPRIHAAARAEAEVLRAHFIEGSVPKDRLSEQNVLQLSRAKEAAPEPESDLEVAARPREPQRQVVSDEELEIWRAQLVGSPGGVGVLREESTHCRPRPGRGSAGRIDRGDPFRPKEASGNLVERSGRQLRSHCATDPRIAIGATCLGAPRRSLRERHQRPERLDFFVRPR